VGTAVILASGLYVFQRERKQSQFEAIGARARAK
jgi:hypothetical protein